jgi:hypothetical protein
MSQVEGTFVKGREEALHTNCGEKLSSHTIAKGGGEDLHANWGENCPRWIRTRKTLRFDIAAMPALAHHADT